MGPGSLKVYSLKNVQRSTMRAWPRSQPAALICFIRRLLRRAAWLA